MNKKDVRYKQCALVNGMRNHMAWIPESFANIGKYIKIKKDDSTWFNLEKKQDAFSLY